MINGRDRTVKTCSCGAVIMSRSHMARHRKAGHFIVMEQSMKIWKMEMENRLGEEKGIEPELLGLIGEKA